MKSIFSIALLVFVFVVLSMMLPIMVKCFGVVGGLALGVAIFFGLLCILPG